MDRHLIGDGLDAATITADIHVLTEDLARFRRDVPEYKEDMCAYPPDRRKRQEPDEFASLLCKKLNDQARRLAEDTATTTGNIRASAELRQAIANTRLQRIVLVVSVLATMVAVISLLVAIG